MGAAPRIVTIGPQTGPQSALLACPANEILYGGARAGGKSYGILLDWVAHEARYGQHARGVLFRRTIPELEDMLEKARAILPGLGWVYAEQRRTWSAPSGSTLKLRYLERDQHADRYQGHQYCVAIGTPVLMASGDYKAIEAIRPGEMVATLEGPKRVTGCVAPYMAPCVRADVYDARGGFIGRQHHPVWHPVLTTAGVSDVRTARSRQSAERYMHGSGVAGSAQVGPSCEDPDNLGWCAYRANGRNGCTGFARSRQDDALPARRSFDAVLFEPYRQLGQPRSGCSRASSRRFHSPDRFCSLLLETFLERLAELRDRMRRFGLFQSTPEIVGQPSPNARSYGLSERGEAQDFQCGYPIERDSCDGPSQTYLKNARGGTPSPADAAKQCLCRHLGVMGTTPKRSHHPQRKYRHPYTGEERHHLAGYSVGSVHVVPCGELLVADICVEDANHYITQTGLVNKNSWMGLDELGSWPRPGPIDKLRATLRSVHVGSRVRMVASANPGGAGHNWIRKRYVIPVAPYRLQHMDSAQSHWTICYIPARFRDNRILYNQDPGYLERATSGLPQWLARAWADGDWDIVAGGALDDLWGPHLILPRFRVPAGWRVDRSFDWGSTAPFSVCWWAEANGEEATLPDGRKWCPPRGTLVQIAEWYGATEIGENKGLKLSAKAVALGIKEREAIFRRDCWIAGPVRPGPADNQIRAVNETDSDSIEKKMADEGVYWAESDKRPGSRKIGLQLIRDRLEASKTGEGAGLFFTDNCRASLAILPTLPRDEKDPDDIDTNADDHIADAVKYRCLAGNNRYATSIDLRFPT